MVGISVVSKESKSEMAETDVERRAIGLKREGLEEQFQTL
jgi:hypothetical protein